MSRTFSGLHDAGLLEASAVQKKPGDDLTIRSRVRGDLDRLRDNYLAQLDATRNHVGTDYAYRAKAPQAAFAEALARIARAIDYSNFKGTVEKRRGWERASAYGKVWSALYDLEAEVDEAG